MVRHFATRAACGALICVLAVAALVGGSSRSALAHAELVTSTPAANSVLEEGPSEIVLDFDESIEASLTSIALFDGESRPVDLGDPTAGADDTIVAVTVPALDDGLYAVVWRITSADGHVVDGAFSFQVGTADEGDGQELIDQVSSGVRADSAVRWWYAAARLLSSLGAIVLVGACGWWLSAPVALAGRRGLRAVVRIAWLSLVTGSAAAFALFGAEAVAGTLGDVVAPSVWGDIATTHTGRMLLLRLTIALVLGALLALRAHRAAGWWRSAGFTAALVTLYTFPAGGHANALDPAALWIAVDLAHLAAITVWVGGLVALAFAGRAVLVTDEGERLAQRFSAAAAVAVPVIVATGVAQTLKLAGGIDELTDTDWGRLLLVKVTVVVTLLAIAGVSRWLLRHDGVASIRRTVVAEAVLGVVVIGLAAGMVGLPPTAPTASQAFAVELSSDGLIAIVSIGPGRVGANEVHITMTPPGGSITPVLSATARVVPVSQELPPAPVELTRDGPNHYTGPVTFPRAGDWTFELVIQVTEADIILLKTTVPIP